MIIRRRGFLKWLGALPLIISASGRAQPFSGFPEQSYRKAIIIDGLGDVVDPEHVEGKNLISSRGIAELKQSGMTAFHTTVNEVGNGLDAYEKTLSLISTTDAFIAANGTLLTKARTAADIRQAKADGKIAVVYGFQDTNVIGPQLERLKLFKDFGVRIVQLTYNKRNLSGDGALEPANAGLSDLGRETIDKIEALHLLLDLAHGGQRTIAEAIAHAKHPMLISHTGCRSLHDHPRNLGDTELKAMANKAGVMGVYFMPFLTANNKPTREDVISHLNHAMKICGEDHVSVGTDGDSTALVIDDKTREKQRKDFEDRRAKGIAAPGEGADIFTVVMDYNSHMRFRMLADDLARAGWPIGRIEKILGGNLLRIYGEAWGA